MYTVNVRASGEYPVYIGSGLLDRCGQLLSERFGGRACAVVTDSTVEPLYAQRVLQSMREQGIRAEVCVFPAGEANKDLASYAALLEGFAAMGLTRSDFVAAVGGGVTGDLAGFAAATWQRGVDYVQLPTTFLAASDSSVGGKTGVDLPAGKNLAGAFWQPKAVICDTDTFATLPEKTFADGAAETLKHGLIADGDFFRFLMAEDIRSHIDDVVRRNVAIKAAVVAEDEFEKGRRKLLNFGHTLGHALEKLSGYSLTHGHAVAVGMVLAARAGERLGLTPRGTLESVLAGNRRYGLPTDCAVGGQELFLAAAGDKKRSGEYIDVVVLREIGRAEAVRLDMPQLREFVEAALWI